MNESRMNALNVAAHGFPVLAYITSEPLSLPFTLRIQHSSARKQVTLMLRTPAAYLYGADDEAAFVAQYDADNLLPGTRHHAATAHIPNTRRLGVARNNNDCELTRLTLCLKKPCPLWCPLMEALTPAPSEDAVKSFNELVELAKATTIRIYFDQDWLSPEQQAPLSWLLKGKNTYTGFPVGRYYSKHSRRADWTVFQPLAEAFTPKRRVSDLPSTPPPYKRRTTDRQSEPDAILDDVANKAQSPTEIATLACKQRKAISAVVQRHLPALVDRLVQPAMDEHLTARLPTLFALPPTFSPSLSDSDGSQSPQDPSASAAALPVHRYNSTPLGARPPHNLTPLGLSLLPHLLAHLSPQLEKLLASALHGSLTYQANAASTELSETADDYLCELRQVCDDGVEELQKQAAYVLDDVREKGGDAEDELVADASDRLWAEGDRVVESAGERVRERGEKVLTNVMQRLEGRLKRASEGKENEEHSIKVKRSEKRQRAR
ncbi:hypothetical protein C7974DRAFT_420546 [Boeremia exigua]|uniref:uncharacterized protein n=1 Tax=Boeremia exigua TaxID=749465 RepID=UPI001E8D99F2|nr:uncharacterized protein C7974DRAFT_420546 [Boeremia exigua]KAH6642235.1 hypothetical protein C7974DRAFT_420546 [Boeremia exigua]